MSSRYNIVETDVESNNDSKQEMKTTEAKKTEQLSDSNPKLSRVLEFREYFRNNIIPANYSGNFHLAFCILCLAICFFTSLYLLRDASWYHWLLLPAFALIGNLVVYIIHKYPLHTPHPLSKNAYQIHTKWHHHFFTHELTTYDSSRDFFILFFS